MMITDDLRTTRENYVLARAIYIEEGSKRAERDYADALANYILLMSTRTSIALLTELYAASKEADALLRAN